MYLGECAFACVCVRRACVVRTSTVSAILSRTWMCLDVLAFVYLLDRACLYVLMQAYVFVHVPTLVSVYKI